MFNISKKIISTVCMVTLAATAINASPHTSLSYSDIEKKVKKESEVYLNSRGYWLSQMPTNIRREYNGKIADITYDLQKGLHGKHLFDYEVRDAITPVMYAFINKTLKSIILQRNLESNLTKEIRDQAYSHGLNPDNIPSRDVAEYINRSEKVMNNLKRIMRNDKRDYVRDNEIKKETEREMKVFFARLKGNKNNSYDWSNNSNSSARIKRYELDGRARDSVNEVLREQGISPDTLPNRVKSAYNDAIKDVVKEMRHKIDRSALNYVTSSDIKSAARRKIKIVIDKLRFEGEKCTICQDKYKKSDRVGILNCGHPYHENCIKTWLGYQKTCHQCRANGVFLSKIERMQ